MVRMISCTTELSDQIDINTYYQMEQEANAFATELLMPEKWLTSIIFKFETIEELLNHITTRTNVSFSAATYNLIKHLPSTYMFDIYNIIDGYSHIKCGSYDNRPTILYYSGYYIDKYWLEINCTDREVIKQKSSSETPIK